MTHFIYYSGHGTCLAWWGGLLCSSAGTDYGVCITIHTSWHSELQTETIWRCLSCLLVIFLSYKFDVLACDVILCMLFHHLSVYLLSVYLLSWKVTASIEVQAAAASLFLPFLMMHCLVQMPLDPPRPIYNMDIRHLCNPLSESPCYGPA